MANVRFVPGGMRRARRHLSVSARQHGMDALNGQHVTRRGSKAEGQTQGKRGWYKRILDEYQGRHSLFRALVASVQRYRSPMTRLSLIVQKAPMPVPMPVPFNNEPCWHSGGRQPLLVPEGLSNECNKGIAVLADRREGDAEDQLCLELPRLTTTTEQEGGHARGAVTTDGSGDAWERRRSWR